MYKDRDEVYYRGLSYDIYRKKSMELWKREIDWYFQKQTKVFIAFFSTSKSKLITGFQNWRSITVILLDHEISKKNMSAMCTMYNRSTKVNTQLLQKNEKELCYWKDVLKRIVWTIKLLSRLGLRFKGHDEGKDSNKKGNYLTFLEYLSEYNMFFFFEVTSTKTCQPKTRNSKLFIS